MNNNFKWWETDKFPYYRIPKDLVLNPIYNKLSAHAVLLYGLLLDRVAISAKNRERFTDRFGDLFVYCTIAEVCKNLNCGHDKATRLFNELEMHELIIKKRQGKGKPNRIYIKPFHKNSDFQ